MSPPPTTKRLIDILLIAEPAGGMIDTEIYGFSRLLIEGQPSSWNSGVLSAVFIEIVCGCSNDFSWFRGAELVE